MSFLISKHHCLCVNTANQGTSRRLFLKNLGLERIRTPSWFCRQNLSVSLLREDRSKSFVHQYIAEEIKSESRIVGGLFPPYFILFSEIFLMKRSNFISIVSKFCAYLSRTMIVCPQHKFWAVHSKSFVQLKINGYWTAKSGCQTATFFTPTTSGAGIGGLRNYSFYYWRNMW